MPGGCWQPCPAAWQGIDLQPCLLPTHRASLSLSRRLSPLIITALYDCFPQIAASGWPRPCCRPAAAAGDSERLQGSWPEEERLLASAANLISSRLPGSGSSGLRWDCQRQGWQRGERWKKQGRACNVLTLKYESGAASQQLSTDATDASIYLGQRPFWLRALFVIPGTWIRANFWFHTTYKHWMFKNASDSHGSSRQRPV